MHKTGKRITGIAVSAMMLLSAAMPAAQTVMQETGITLTAFAAENPSDMVQNPSRYFEFSADENYPGQIKITRFIGNNSVIRIPGTINGKPVSRIDCNWRTPFIASESCRSQLRQVIIDYNLKEIGDCAFGSCRNLQTINIPSSVTTIASNAFASCTGLQNVSFGRYMSDIPSRLFNDCTNLTNADSVNSAKTLLIGGAKRLYTINNSPIATYRGAYTQPYLDSRMYSFFMDNYEKFDEAVMLQDYERWYASYIVYGRLGINNSMTDVQKAAKIVLDMKNRVVYDTDAWNQSYDSYGNVVYGPTPGYSASAIAKTHVAGSALWGTKSVCEGFSEALSLLFSEAGLTNYLAETRCYDNVYENGRYVTKDAGGHEFNVVFVDDGYYIIDVTSYAYEGGFMVSAGKQAVNRNTRPVKTWSFMTYRAGYVSAAGNSYLATVLTKELGDLNSDGRVNQTDVSILNSYYYGSTAQKSTILGQVHLSKSAFETKADADGSGRLDSNDLYALNRRYEYGKMINYV